ncbi:MAG TPA: S9 family peptidase, partial [Dehalococcoidia bacterium]|nr:S9 family peptidase [Dehalococcoidia bacterium]
MNDRRTESKPGRPGMEPGDLFRLRWLSDAQVAPDGTRVAFVVTTLEEEKDRYRAAIWLVPCDGSAPARQFTAGEGRDTAPRWSPDGRSLAFLSDRDGEKAQIHVIAVDGGEARRLTSLKQGAGAPLWSPDGRRICFVAKLPVDEQDAEAREKGGKDKKAPPARVITTLKYKLNAEGFTYDKRKHLFVVDGESGDLTQLTAGEFDDDQPCWSADGASILFISARHAERDYDRVRDVWRVPATGGEPERLTDTSFTTDSVTCGPSGEIVFGADHDPDDPPRHTRLWLLEGGAARCLTADFDRNLVTGSGASGPLWLADGRTILVSAHEGGNVPVVAVDAQSGQVRTVIGGERSVASFSVDAGASRIAFCASTGDAPVEVYVAAIDGTSERRLTGLNDAWLAEVSLATPKRLRVPGGGGTIDAWLLRPPGYRPGTPHPLLLNIHGGPFAQYGNTFLDEFQVQAGAGFGVLYCNPRGSSGYGEEFARAIIGSTGIEDTEDVLAALEHVLATEPDIDPTRLGVLGGSYGGYLTSWIIGHSNRFAAACSERGINNRLSKAGTDDLYTTRTYFRDEVWRDPELFLRLSPLMYVEQIRCPVLLLHSEEDLRC